MPQGPSEGNRARSPLAPPTGQALWLALIALGLEALFLAVRGLSPLDVNVIELVAAGLAASVLYLVAAWLVLSWRRTSPATLVVMLLAAVVFRLTLAPLPPTLSHDLYRYLYDGRVQQAGLNPYLVTPDSSPAVGLTPLERQLVPGPAYPAAYPPLTELLFRLAAEGGGLGAFKLLSLLFDGGTLLLILALLAARGQPLLHALLYAWCPLVILEFAGSGHNDSITIFFLLLALLLIIRQRPGVSIAALAAATLAKWFAGMLLPVFLRRARVWMLGVFAAVLAALAWPYHDAGWRLLGGVTAYAQHWRNNSSLFALLAGATGSDHVAGVIALALLAGLVFHLTRARTDPLRAAYLLIGALLLVSPSVFPWYVTWLVPFLCFYPNPAGLLFTATVLLSYHVLIGYTAAGVWSYTPALVTLEYVPVYALLFWSWWRSRRSAPQRSGG